MRILMLCMLTLGIPAMAQDFSFNLEPDHLDILSGGKIWLRTVTPEFDVDNREETYKVFTHIYDAAGADPITKGTGGLYPHHRGMFIGWKDTLVGDVDYDTWHMANCYQEHAGWDEMMVFRKADPSMAAHLAIPFDKEVAEKRLPSKGISLEHIARMEGKPNGAYLTVQQPQWADAQELVSEMNKDEKMLPTHTSLVMSADDASSERRIYLIQESPVFAGSDLDIVLKKDAAAEESTYGVEFKVDEALAARFAEATLQDAGNILVFVRGEEAVVEVPLLGKIGPTGRIMGRFTEDDAARLSMPGKERAVQTERILWKNDQGEAFIRESRRITASSRTAANLRVIDFSSTLDSLQGTIQLKGDLQHAGMQVRMANEVSEHPESTEYTLPFEAELHEDDRVTGADWACCSCVVNGARYWVLHMTPESNVTGTPVYSIRPYARFGAFFETGLQEGSPLELRFRIILSDQPLERSECIRLYRSYNQEMP